MFLHDRKSGTLTLPMVLRPQIQCVVCPGPVPCYGLAAINSISASAALFIGDQIGSTLHLPPPPPAQAARPGTGLIGNFTKMAAEPNIQLALQNR